MGVHVIWSRKCEINAPTPTNLIHGLELGTFELQRMDEYRCYLSRMERKALRGDSLWRRMCSRTSRVIGKCMKKRGTSCFSLRPGDVNGMTNRGTFWRMTWCKVPRKVGWLFRQKVNTYRRFPWRRQEGYKYMGGSRWRWKCYYTQPTSGLLLKSQTKSHRILSPLYGIPLFLRPVPTRQNWIKGLWE